MHSELGPVRQNPIQRTVSSVHVCAVHCAQLLHTILHRADLIIFPLGLQVNRDVMQLNIVTLQPQPESGYGYRTQLK